jgi:hypothetical protein
LTRHFRINENSPQGQQWFYYYLGDLESVGRLSGQRFIGPHDWYSQGAKLLLTKQDPLRGFWQGAGPVEGQQPPGVVATSFALVFLGRGGAPVLIQKARHAPENDWRNDPDDVRNLVRSIARDRKQPLDSQVVDLEAATVDDLLRAPTLFLNGHRAPELGDRAKATLRVYLERGGFLFADACCGKAEFDQGFRGLLTELFPAGDSPLHPLAPDHPIWSARHALKPDVHPLWGLEQNGRTVLVYSPGDLSCVWNLHDPTAPLSKPSLAIRVGQNVVGYAVDTKAVPH